MSDNVEQFPSAMRDAMQKMQAEIDGLLEYQRFVARLQREKYGALLDQGFTKEQALVLCERVMP